MDGYICYFEPYSVTLYHPNGYLHVQHIGCPRKIVVPEITKVFSGHQ